MAHDEDDAMAGPRGKRRRKAAAQEEEGRRVAPERVSLVDAKAVWDMTRALERDADARFRESELELELSRCEFVAHVTETLLDDLDLLEWSAFAREEETTEEEEETEEESSSLGFTLSENTPDCAWTSESGCNGEDAADVAGRSWHFKAWAPRGRASPPPQVRSSQSSLEDPYLF